MKKLLLITALVPNLCFATDVFLNVGYVNYPHSGNDRNTASIMLNAETKDKYPWTYSLSFVPEYDRKKNLEVKSHWTGTLGKQINYTFDNGIKVYAELGAAALTEKTGLSSSYLNFYETVGIGYERFRLTFRHISNAGSGKYNRGEDVVYLGWNIVY